ncbi:hypothetical protein [Streptomyces sp. NPDC001492]
MADTPPTATVAGQSIALHVVGYPDVPNRWGAGRIRATGIRIDYGSTISPDARHAVVTGLWVRDDGEVTDNPLDRYYDAPDGGMAGWPDWIADLARKHTPPVQATETREAVCICGHPEQQHFEDVCLTQCGCSDFLTAEAATEERARAEAAIHALRSAAEHVRVGVAVGPIPLEVRPAVAAWLCRLADQRRDRAIAHAVAAAEQKPTREARS